MEHRKEKRVNVDVKCTIYLPTSVDIGGELLNVSEAGVCVRILNYKGNLTGTINVGTLLKFQAVDTYNIMSLSKTNIFQGKMSVVYVRYDEDFIYLGCSVYSNDKGYNDYVIGKQLEHQIEEILGGS